MKLVWYRYSNQKIIDFLSVPGTGIEDRNMLKWTHDFVQPNLTWRRKNVKLRILSQIRIENNNKSGFKGGQKNLQVRIQNTVLPKSGSEMPGTGTSSCSGYTGSDNKFVCA
jgi:hypothetical protein